MDQTFSMLIYRIEKPSGVYIVFKQIADDLIENIKK